MVRSDRAVRLVRRNTVRSEPRVWGAEGAALFDFLRVARAAVGWRPWQVLGGPGTGKTALLIDLVAECIAAGVDPGSVLVVTHSKRPVGAVRDAITARFVFEGGRGGGVLGASRDPLVRTIH